MNKRRLPDLALQTERAKPSFLIGIQNPSRPLKRYRGGGTEPFKGSISGSGFVMIPKDTRPGEMSHDLEALHGICVVPDDIPQAMKLNATVLPRIGKNCLESLQIGMDIAKDCAAHSAGR
jgi:hypothetical protein